MLSRDLKNIFCLGVNNGISSRGPSHVRIYIVDRKDDMFIVSGVHIFPSDAKFVMRGLEGITSEYQIRISEKDYTARYIVEVEKQLSNTEYRS